MYLLEKKTLLEVCYGSLSIVKNPCLIIKVKVCGSFRLFVRKTLITCNCGPIILTESLPSLEFSINIFLGSLGTKIWDTVNSFYSGHCRDLEVVSSLARVRNSGSLFQSNVCNLFLPGIYLLSVLSGCPL